MKKYVILIAFLLLLLVSCVDNTVIDITPFNELTLKKNTCHQEDDKIVEEAQEITITNTQKLRKINKMIEINNNSQQNEIEKELELVNEGVNEMKNKLIERESKLVECLGYLEEIDNFIEDNYVQLEEEGLTPQLKRENTKISIDKYEEMLIAVRKSIFETELALS